MPCLDSNSSALACEYISVCGFLKQLREVKPSELRVRTKLAQPALVIGASPLFLIIPCQFITNNLDGLVWLKFTQVEN